MSGRVDRRDMLKGLAAALGSAVVAPACRGRDGVLPATAADLAVVASLYFGNALGAARAVGAFYLQRFASPEEIRRDLDLTFAALAPIISPREVAVRLERALEAELAQADVVSLAGWQLGPTELRVAAVAELTARVPSTASFRASSTAASADARAETAQTAGR